VRRRQDFFLNFFGEFDPQTLLCRVIPVGGEEIFVIEGEIEEIEDIDGVSTTTTYKKWNWIRRNDTGKKISRKCSNSSGCAIYIKTGHLPPQ
jgi:hypothetical protein